MGEMILAQNRKFQCVRRRVQSCHTTPQYRQRLLQQPVCTHTYHIFYIISPQIPKINLNVSSSTACCTGFYACRDTSITCRNRRASVPAAGVPSRRGGSCHARLTDSYCPSLLSFSSGTRRSTFGISQSHPTLPVAHTRDSLAVFSKGFKMVFSKLD